LILKEEKRRELRHGHMVEKAKISEKEKADIRTLVKFVEIYCRGNHNGVRYPFSLRSPNYELITPN
jgi:hypothetical protein